MTTINNENNTPKVSAFYIKREPHFTDEMVKGVFDKAVSLGVNLTEGVEGFHEGAATVTRKISNWDYFGVSVTSDTFFWDNPVHFSKGGDGSCIEQATLITMEDVDTWLGIVTEEGEGEECTNTTVKRCESACDKSLSVGDTIASVEKNALLRQSEGSLGKDESSGKDISLNKQHTLSDLIALTKGTNISFTIINGRAELEWEEMIFKLTHDKIDAILDAIKVLDDNKEEES